MTVTEDERTTELGLFNYAASYRGAADALGTMKLSTTHPETPRSFLYVHAIELYIKAFLRASGCSLDEIEALRHNWQRLRSAYEENGGRLTDEDVDVVRNLAASNASIRFRYIETGFSSWATPEALSRTAESLHDTVRSRLKRAGQPVR
jgi:hypothetical protein